jgi:uncharacterized protein YbjT (DUF2867 family)
MILLCGATGLLGSNIAERLSSRGERFRALLRPGTDDTSLRQLGAEPVRGDLRQPDTLKAALEGVSNVISTATVMARALAGETDLTIRDVDERGHANLIKAAETGGARRFVYLSIPAPMLARDFPLARAKRATEGRLRDSSLTEVIVRPEMFQEVWLAPIVGFDWPRRNMTIYGRGETGAAYVAVDDVAEAVVRLALADDPRRLVEIGGPEALTRRQAADAFEHAIGLPIRRKHVPRAALRVGSTLLRRIKPVLASVMGMALVADLEDSRSPTDSLVSLGIAPRPASAYIRDAVAAAEAGPQNQAVSESEASANVGR